MRSHRSNTSSNWPSNEPSSRLSSAERGRLEALGYVVRERVFDSAELERLREDCERLVARLKAADPGTPRLPMGSYLFQALPALCTIVKWEPAHPDVVQGVEPFAHFDPALRAWAGDPRLVDPMRDLLPTAEVGLFTEKLNLKRARVGGPVVLHQDYPYWVENSDGPGEIATAMIFLDDADRESGCLELLPGSHAQGLRPGRNARGFGKLEMDPEGPDASQLVAVEVPAGSVAFFGSLLVHRSAPNRSPRDRRALLFSYQPAARRTARDSLASLLGW